MLNYANAVFNKNPEVSTKDKQDFLRLYRLGLSQEKAKSMILGRILVKHHEDGQK